MHQNLIPATPIIPVKGYSFTTTAGNAARAKSHALTAIHVDVTTCTPGTTDMPKYTLECITKTGTFREETGNLSDFGWGNWMVDYYRHKGWTCHITSTETADEARARVYGRETGR
jgi:chitodextrinase